MDRRTFIGTVGASVAVAVAGCTESGSNGDGTGGRNGTATTESTTSDGDTPSTTGATETTNGTKTTDVTETADGSGASTTDTATDEGSATEGESLAVVDTSFEVTSNDCGGGVDEATASVDGDTVTVEGTIGGRNGCETARIAETTVKDGTLTVSVETYVPETEEPQGCVECLVDIVYTSTLTVEGGPLDAVVVRHGDEQVAKTAP